MAARSLQLFLNQISGAPTQFKLRLLQVVFDVLMVHESDFLSAGSGDNVSPRFGDGPPQIEILANRAPSAV
jgi:hypothetical protein